LEVLAHERRKLGRISASPGGDDFLCFPVGIVHFRHGLLQEGRLIILRARRPRARTAAILRSAAPSAWLPPRRDHSLPALSNRVASCPRQTYPSAGSAPAPPGNPFHRY